MSITKVGGSFAAHATLSLGERAALECEVHGITDEDAARVLLGDTQVGVARRLAEQDFIALKVPASFLGNAMLPVLLRVEVGRTRVTHGRSGAEQSLDWRHVATLTVHPERAFAMSFAAGAIALLHSGLVMIEALPAPSQSSRARLIADACTVALCTVPLLMAARAKAKGVSRWPAIRNASVVTALLALGSTAASVAVDNRTGAEITLSNGARLSTGVSRWLPFEPSAQRNAIEQRFQMLGDRDVRECVAPIDARPLSTRLWPGTRVALRGVRSAPRSVLQRLGIAEHDLCDRVASEGESCCIRPDRREITVPMQSVATAGVRGEWRVHTQSASGESIDGQGFGRQTVRVLAWHGLSLSGARRSVGMLEARWTAEPAIKAMTLEGFAVDTTHAVDLLVANGPTVHASCPSTSDTVHVIRAMHGSLRAVTVDAARVDLRANQPSFLCTSGAPQRLSISVDPGQHTPNGAPAWAALEPWPLPVSRPTVTIFERRGSVDVEIGTAHCPVDRTRNLSIVPVRTEGFSLIERIESHPEGGRSTRRWDATAETPRGWAFLCVESDASDVPTAEPSHGTAPNALALSRDFRVHEAGQISPAHGVLTRADRWVLALDRSPLPELASCCYDPDSGVLVTCPAIHRYQRLVQRGDNVPEDCGKVLRIEWVRRPRRVEIGADGRMTPSW